MIQHDPAAPSISAGCTPLWERSEHTVSAQSSASQLLTSEQQLLGDYSTPVSEQT